MTLEQVGKKLNPHVDLSKFKVRLPKAALSKYKAYYGGEPEMFIVGSFMGDFFMSPDAKDVKSRRLYPLPPGIDVKEMLGWEVVE